MPRSPEKPPRRRRDVAVVRAEILDAAERCMIEVGPDGVRLQDVARAVGISHSNVLHHFGSKEALLGALVERSVEGMRAEIVEAIATADVGGDRLYGLLEALARVLTQRGHARLLFWLTLGGHAPGAASGWLGEVVDATLMLRKARGQKVTLALKSDTQHAVMLASLVLTGAAVLWPIMPSNIGMATDEAAAVRFRRWFADLLLEHLRLRPDAPATAKKASSPRSR